MAFLYLTAGFTRAAPEKPVNAYLIFLLLQKAARVFSISVTPFKE